MKPYIPVYCRPPNKLIKYEKRNFDGGIVLVAIFHDKKGRVCEMVSQVLWDN